MTSAAERVGRAADIHIEIDTGIGRAGFNWKDVWELEAFLDDAIKLGVRWAGS
ncbi:MAG: hypothetical protein CM1200mP14_15900 [Gammaproteobacteria bacterium]|nr:MAG: hypothetical protein CM1200mP14_15900 [Gammaproteobacteria bacterium]